MPGRTTSRLADVISFPRMIRRRPQRQLAPAQVEARLRRRVATLPAAGFFGLVLASAWPSTLASWESFAFPAALALLGGGLLYAGILLRQPFVAMLGVLNASAYAPGLGDAVRDGMPLAALQLMTRGDSVQAAIGMLVLFLVTAAAGSVLLVPSVARWLPRKSLETQRRRRSVWAGLGLLLAASFAISLATGTWSAYGAEHSLGSRDGMFRLEFFYDPALFGAFGLTTTRLSREYSLPPAQRGRTRWLWMFLSVVVLLQFTRQIRRMMLASIVYAVVAVIDELPLAQRLLRSPSRLLAGALLLATVMAGVLVGSNVWRRSATEFSTNSIGQRVADLSGRISETSAEDLSQDRDRLTYLGLDAATIENQAQLSGAFSLDDLFLRTVIVNTPGMVLRSKYLYPMQTCETAFLRLGGDTDLPCTPQSEGYLAAGLVGVVVVALSWSLLLAFATALYRQGGSLALVGAMHLILPLTSLETSAFPIVSALRIAALGCGAIALLAALSQMLRGSQLRVLPTPRRPSPRQR